VARLRARLERFLAAHPGLRFWRPPGPPIEPHDVWIVVLNWRRRDDTLACLASLARADLGGATILVVDNGSRDDSAAAVRARYPEVRVLELSENRGFAGGCNAGMRAALAAGARAILLLNNDTEAAPDFLAPMLAVLNRWRWAGAVSGAVLRADSPQVLDCAWLDVYFGHGIVRRRGVNALPGEGYDRVRRIDAGLGSCLLLRAGALERVGLLDEDYFAYHEEVDWCVRARKAWYAIYYQPYARVWHRGSSSTADRTRPPPIRARPAGPQLANPIPLSWNPVRTYLGARNAVRFMRRHGSWWRKAYFALSSLHALPLELLAVVLEREEELKLGVFTYHRALALYCLECEAGGSPAGGGGGWLRLRALLRAPRHLLVSLPADVRRARERGATAELEEHLRGLRDGWHDRPLPLERLGLR
jgi:GT2 family glycosyltransferase